MNVVKKLANAIRKNDDAPTKHELRSIVLYIVAFVALLLVLGFAFSNVGHEHA